MDNRRDNSRNPAGRSEWEDKDRKNVMYRRDEQLDEELRGQLRKKNEENKKHLSEGTGNDGMDSA